MNHSIKFLALTVATLALVGCDNVSFLFPLTENPQDLAADIDLSGVFHAEDGDQWLFEKNGDGRYQLTWSDKDDSIRLDAAVVRVSNLLFLDASTKEEGTGIRGHMFARLRLEGDILEISWLDTTWMRKKLTERSLAFERPCARGQKDCRYIVTSPSGLLQSFLVRHAEDIEAFGKPDKLRR
jgi:hypothetical protein